MDRAVIGKEDEFRLTIALRQNRVEAAQRAELEVKNDEMAKTAGTDAEKVNGESFVLIRQAGESGQLYGSVSPRDIAEAVVATGITINRNQVELAEPIKTIGLHDVRIILHPEVDASISINVARSDEEAERQASGEDLTESVLI